MAEGMSEPILTYYNIAPRVLAFSTTRHGGAGRGNYGELNINPYCGDDSGTVAANRKSLETRLGIADDRLFIPHQVHGTKNLQVTGDVLSRPIGERLQLLEGIDSLTTDLRGVCIGVSTADCIPVLLYDPVHGAAAAVHAGWRGTVKRIVQETCRSMFAAFGSRTCDMRAVIGPGISQKNFEVGQEVYDSFAANGFDMNVIARKFPCLSAPGTERWHIDLPLCNELQLEDAGVPDDNIIQSLICTYDSCDDYFSARRLGPASGRIYTGIIMR